MKQIISLLSIAILATSCQQQQKTGFVNNSELINEYQGKKYIEEKYKALEDASRKKGDSLNQAYQLEAISLQEKMRKMSQKQQQSAAEPFQKKWQLINQQVQTEQQNLQAKFQTEIDSSISDVVDFIKGYAKTNGYSYIFGTSDVSRSVMYGDEANDLTETVLKSLNDSYTKK